MAGELDHVMWMGEALTLARRAGELGEIPVGAIVVHHAADMKPQIIGRGFNRREVDDDPSAHAEIVAMRQAGREAGKGGWGVTCAGIFLWRGRPEVRTTMQRAARQRSIEV